MTFAEKVALLLGAGLGAVVIAGAIVVPWFSRATKKSDDDD